MPLYISPKVSKAHSKHLHAEQWNRQIRQVHTFIGFKDERLPFSLTLFISNSNIFPYTSRYFQDTFVFYKLKEPYKYISINI